MSTRSSSPRPSTCTPSVSRPPSLGQAHLLRETGRRRRRRASSACCRASDKASKKQSIQFGFQQRFSPEYLTAYDYYKTGKVGDIKMMMSYWNLGGVPPKPPATPPAPVADEKVRRWGSWMAQSGGVIVEQDCHGVDMLNWFAGDAHPLKARGTGSLRYPLAYGRSG
jgi:predicted dehydrogenase